MQKPRKVKYFKWLLRSNHKGQGLAKGTFCFQTRPQRYQKPKGNSALQQRPSENTATQPVWLQWVLTLARHLLYVSKSMQLLCSEQVIHNQVIIIKMLITYGVYHLLFCCVKMTLWRMRATSAGGSGLQVRIVLCVYLLPCFSACFGCHVTSPSPVWRRLDYTVMSPPLELNLPPILEMSC